MRKQVTMKDIAQEMGVSIVTVSKALSGKDGVGEELREKIIDKAHELNYVIKGTQDDSWVIPDRDSNGFNIELKLPDVMPEAFFCNCDETAYRMIRTLNEAGYKVPEDIAVVGFDDYASLIPDDIELTTYQVDIDGMVRQCIHIVDQRSRNPAYRRGIVLVRGTLVERKTVKILSEQ